VEQRACPDRALGLRCRGVTEKLICARSARLPCRATETPTTTETTETTTRGRPVAHSESTRPTSRRVTIGAKRVRIRPGKKVTVTVKLNAAGRTLLGQFGKLPMTLTITQRQDGRPLAVVNSKLTVKRRQKQTNTAVKRAPESRLSALQIMLAIPRVGCQLVIGFIAGLARDTASP
jgi:hypothetical protein